jgi:chromosome segregation ATPase
MSTKPAGLTDCFERVMNLETALAKQIDATTTARNELAGMDAKLAGANEMLTARNSEIRELTQERDRHRRDIDGLKVRLHLSEQEVARLSGQLERVHEGDRLRLAAMGRAPAQRGPIAMTVGESPMSGANGRERDDVDWVTF